MNYNGSQLTVRKPLNCHGYYKPTLIGKNFTQDSVYDPFMCLYTIHIEFDHSHFDIRFFKNNMLMYAYVSICRSTLFLKKYLFIFFHKIAVNVLYDTISLLYTFYYMLSIQYVLWNAHKFSRYVIPCYCSHNFAS